MSSAKDGVHGLAGMGRKSDIVLRGSIRIITTYTPEGKGGLIVEKHRGFPTSNRTKPEQQNALVELLGSSRSARRVQGVLRRGIS